MALFHRIKAPFAEAVPEDEAGTLAGPRTVGDVLRERREELGLELEDCGAALNIKPAYLEALEDGRPDRLPGPTYATGFVRAYAAYLNLDSAATLRRFKAESAGLDAKPDLAVPVPLSERSMPGSAMLMVALILVICGYGTWYYLSTAERSRPQRVSDVPAALLPSKPQPPAAAMQTATPAPPPAATGVTVAPAAPPLATPKSAAIATPAPPTAAAMPAAAAPANAAPAANAARPGAMAAADPVVKPAAALTPPKDAPTPAAADAAHIYGTANGSSRIVIHANADSWVQISDGDHTLFTRTLKAGDSYRVPDQPGITMRTGNAGGLDIAVDGHSVPAIGPSGMLVRDVALDPQALTAGTAVHD